MATDEATNAGAVERTYDRESNFRQRLGLYRWPAYLLGSGLTIFQLYTALYGNFVSLVQGAVHVGAAMGLVFLLYPAKKSWAGRGSVPWYDLLSAAGSLAAGLYIVVSYDRLVTTAIVFGYTQLDYVVAISGIVLVLEGTRRCVGLPIVLIACAALAYGVLGSHIPVFGHAGFSVDQMAAETFLTSSSVFGTPIQVSSTYIYLFLLFGVILVETNIGKFFSDLAFAATGRFQGGTAKAAVVASGLQGMVSGSSVSNTVGSGSFTIPMMKRAGFRPEVAGATEASASTGGQIMPPVMGAAAFIMAAFTGISYNEIIVIAAVPAVMYFCGVFAAVHFEAGRRGIVGLPRAELPPVGDLFKRLYLFAPLVAIVGTLLYGRTPTFAALLGVGTAFVVSFLRADTRVGLKRMATLLERGARTALPVIAACATAGIVAGTVTKTGVGSKLAAGVVQIGGGNLLLVLMLTMVACLILGMGLPTTANYVVTATIAAPILVGTFDVPLIAAHMFVFYFGIVADITPPVCLAAYAGAGIAGANPMRTGGIAFKLAIGGFIIPFVFIADPALLLQDTSITEFVPVFVTALLGIAAVSAGIMGHLLADLSAPPRLTLVLGGALLVWPTLGISLAGLAIVAGIGLTQWMKRRHSTIGQVAT